LIGCLPYYSSILEAIYYKHFFTFYPNLLKLLALLAKAYKSKLKLDKASNPSESRGKTVPTTNCPYEQAIQLVGNRWSLQIVKELHLRKQPLRFNEFMRALKPISSKTLSAKLKELTTCGVINKEVIAETPVLIKYSLTPKGQELTPILDGMAQWTIKWRNSKQKSV